MNYRKFLGPVSLVLMMVIVTLMWAPAAGAATKYKVLHKFKYTPEGGSPLASLIWDAAGNLYGTTAFGGGPPDYNSGTVFKLTPNPDGSWTHTVLYSFCSLTNCIDGAYPFAGLIFDEAGNLYGTTYSGGNFPCDGESGCGTVFKLTPNPDGTWTESVLYSFSGSPDGANPYADLIFDAAGSLYGTTAFGGGLAGRNTGTVFKLTPNPDGTWTETVLYDFSGGADGTGPAAGLIFDASGNLYGTSTFGPYPGYNGGTVFEISPNSDGSWTEKVLYTFTGSPDGANPYADLIFDAAGSLYGTTTGGGAGYGTVFKLTPNPDGSWTESVIRRFANHVAATPFAGLIFDAAGSLYGTTWQGGNNPCSYSGALGCGSVYKLTPNRDGSWAYSVLHVFQEKPASGPHAGLILDQAGNLYGTTSACDIKHTCAGTVFKITP